MPEPSNIPASSGFRSCELAYNYEMAVVDILIFYRLFQKINILHTLALSHNLEIMILFALLDECMNVFEIIN